MMTNNPLKVGVIGCGMISNHYLAHLPQFNILELTTCADVLPDRAAEQALKHRVPKACSAEELLDDPNIDIVVNLTTPRVHSEVSLSILRAGKHLYSEKPLGITRDEGLKILALAKDNGLRVGCAPDTFLGGGLQTCRKLIDDGVIGEPIAATASLTEKSDLRVPSDRAFSFGPGAGAMLDLGVYYLTALVNILGPIRWVTGMISTPFPERVLVDGPAKGSKLPVTVATHATGSMEMVSGALVSVIISTDVFAGETPHILVYGTKGTLRVPDPNEFRGPVHTLHDMGEEWKETPLTHAYTSQSRGLGVADLAQAITSGKNHRASGQLAYHVLDAMIAFEDSALQRTQIELQSECPRPAPMPSQLEERVIS
ncbi:MAG: Gfo/Idh/MocA family oxidoreductase [SAR202 cluster bacterium]|nr:Gfo/Idh/MocA family oxidoreductase [SAR202 cluster bacterium]